MFTCTCWQEGLRGCCSSGWRMNLLWCRLEDRWAHVCSLESLVIEAHVISVHTLGLFFIKLTSSENVKTTFGEGFCFILAGGTGIGFYKVMGTDSSLFELCGIWYFLQTTDRWAHISVSECICVISTNMHVDVIFFFLHTNFWHSSLTWKWSHMTQIKPYVRMLEFKSEFTTGPFYMVYAENSKNVI